MTINVRLSIETASMLEELKRILEKQNGTFFSKGDTLAYAILNIGNSFEDIDWNEITYEKLDIKEYNINSGALRPKIELTNEAEGMLQNFKILLADSLGLRNVTMGVCIKYVLKYALLQIIRPTVLSIEHIINIAFQDYLNENNIDQTELYNIKNYLLYKFKKYKIEVRDK